MIRRLIARVRAWRRHPDLLTDTLRDRIDGVDGRRTPFDLHVAQALAPWADEPRDIRTVCAALSLYRDGVDIYAGAPKEMP